MNHTLIAISNDKEQLVKDATFLSQGFVVKPYFSVNDLVREAKGNPEAIESARIVLSYSKPFEAAGVSLSDTLKDTRLKHAAFILVADSFTYAEKKEAAKSTITDLCHSDKLQSEEVLQRLQEYAESVAEVISEEKKKSKFTFGKPIKLPVGKRLFDVLFSFTLIVFLLPIFAVISALILIESSGPLLYVSKRVGAGYTTFDFFKFRTMFVNADKQLEELKHLNQYQGSSPSIKEVKQKCEACLESNTACQQMLYADNDFVCEKLHLEFKKGKKASTFVKVKKDPRITKVGRFLRKTSLDELPQLFNVLKGDMSVIGNRPLPVYEAEQLTKDQGVKRFLAPAGITGLWQVEKRGKGDMSPEERIELDNQYAENHSFALDLKILLKTIPAMIQKEDV